MANKVMSLFDYINAPEITAYIKDRPENKIPYFGETLFPAKRQLGTDISWLKGSNGLPVAIQPSSYDVKARMRDHSGFESVATEMAFFREGMRIGEKDRQQLNMLLNNPQSDLALPIIRKIFDDASKLVEGVRVQNEIMRMQLLTAGKIDVTSADGRAKYVYNYGQGNVYKCGKDRAVWGEGNAKADPVRDILDLLDDMEVKTGKRPSRLVMARNTFINMIRCPKVHGMMYPDDSAMHMYLSDAKAKAFIEEVCEVNIFVYSKKVALLDQATGVGSTTDKALIPDGVVCVLPSGNLGNTYYGTTPEESDLMSGTDAQVSIVNSGIAVTTYKEPHPVNVVTIVSACTIPSFEAIDNCAILKVDAVAE